jgi:hypothetical protein
LQEKIYHLDKIDTCEKIYHLGPIFRTFLPAESDFPRKIPWNLLEKMIFQTLFRGKFQFFQNCLEENLSNGHNILQIAIKYSKLP